MGSKSKDLTGQRFGMLVAVRRNGTSPNGYAKWECQCDCGNKTISNGADLRRGHKKSCGCIKHRVTPTYLTWNGEKRSVCDWAIITGISPDLIRKRWKAGWPVDAIFTEVEKPQLCWGCAKACGGCSWSKRFEPVPWLDRSANATVRKNTVIPNHRMPGVCIGRDGVRCR